MISSRLVLLELNLHDSMGSKVKITDLTTTTCNYPSAIAYDYKRETLLVSTKIDVRKLEISTGRVS